MLLTGILAMVLVHPFVHVHVYMRACGVVLWEKAAFLRVPWVDSLLCGVDGLPVCPPVSLQVAVKLRSGLGLGLVL
jgi:hypothetical protein